MTALTDDVPYRVNANRKTMLSRMNRRGSAEDASLDNRGSAGWEHTRPVDTPFFSALGMEGQLCHEPGKNNSFEIDSTSPVLKMPLRIHPGLLCPLL